MMVLQAIAAGTITAAIYIFSTVEENTRSMRYYLSRNDGDGEDY